MNLSFCKKIVIFVCKNLLCIRFSSQQIPSIKLMAFLPPIEISSNTRAKKHTSFTRDYSNGKVFQYILKYKFVKSLLRHTKK